MSKGLSELVFNKFFTPNTHRHTITTRAITNKELQLPKCNTEIRKNSFAVRGVKIWNSIPLHIRQSSTLPQFKAAIKLHYWQNFDSTNE